MGRFVLNGEPYLSGNFLVWSATLDPGTFEQVGGNGEADVVDTFHMQSDDPAGLNATATPIDQRSVPIPPTMPGDSYQSSQELFLHDGYYHVMLTIDERDSDMIFELHISSSGGAYELKSWHQVR